MYIHFNNNNIANYFNKSILVSIITQQKKIFAIVSMVFGFLAICYAARRYSLNQKTAVHIQPVDNPTKNREGKINEKKEGEFKDNLLDGFGVSSQKFSDETLVEIVRGQFKINFAEKGDKEFIHVLWKGKIIHPNGDALEGEFDAEGNLQGSVNKMILSNGDKFEGEFKDNKPWKGKWTFLNGSVQEGEFNHKEFFKGEWTFSLNGKKCKVFFENGEPIEGKVFHLNGEEEKSFKVNKLDTTPETREFMIIYPDGKTEKKKCESNDTKNIVEIKFIHSDEKAGEKTETIKFKFYDADTKSKVGIGYSGENIEIEGKNEPELLTKAFLFMLDQEQFPLSIFNERI